MQYLGIKDFFSDVNEHFRSTITFWVGYYNYASDETLRKMDFTGFILDDTQMKNEYFFEEQFSTTMNLWT